MTREQIIQELVEQDRLSEEEVSFRLQDRDLWLLRPQAHFDEDLRGDEGVRLWEEAAQVAWTIADIVSNGPGTIQVTLAITQLVWDAAARAEVALERARRRSGEREE